MSGSLVLIDSQTASSSASISLTGISATYDVYMLVIIDSSSASDNVDFRIRVTKASDSSADTTTNYDAAAKEILTSSTGNIANTSQSFYNLDIRSGTGTEEVMNGICYLFNFFSSSDYCFITMENSFTNAVGNQGGTLGGGVHKVAQSSNGVNISYSSGNIASGEFKLYGLRK